MYSLEDGRAHEVWRNIGVPVTILQTGQEMASFVNWLKYVNPVYKSGICYKAKIQMLAGYTWKKTNQGLPLQLVEEQYVQSLYS